MFDKKKTVEHNNHNSWCKMVGCKRLPLQMSLFRRSFVPFPNVELKFWNNCAQNGKRKTHRPNFTLKMYVKKPLTMAHFNYTNQQQTVIMAMSEGNSHKNHRIHSWVYIANERIDVWPKVYSLWFGLVWSSFMVEIWRKREEKQRLIYFPFVQL